MIRKYVQDIADAGLCRAVDNRGRPVAAAITPGNMTDIKMALPLLEDLTPTRRFLVDKAYHIDGLRNWRQTRHVKTVLPSNAMRKKPYRLHKTAYRRRNVIERMSGYLKAWRRIATRGACLTQDCLSAIALVSAAACWANRVLDPAFQIWTTMRAAPRRLVLLSGP
ncbi:MAG: transposase [Pseudomonadota bacterium]